jgi:hypothetical protein
MSLSKEELSSLWEEMKVLVSTLDVDVQKAVFSENKSASTRARQGLLHLVKRCKVLKSELLVLSKELAAQKKAAKAEEK